MITWSHSGPLDGGILCLMAMYVSWMEVGGVVGLPQTPLALLPFLPGRFDDLYVKVRITRNTRILPVGTSQTGAV